MGLACLMFVPSCMFVQTVAAPFRFGVFHYDNFAAVDDWRIERFLPASAMDITLEKPAHTNGFRAKYKISKTELEKWLDETWNQAREYAVDSREEAQEVVSVPHFEDLGWPTLADAVRYEGPRKDNYAGFTIWYSESEGIAYEDAGYW